MGQGREGKGEVGLNSADRRQGSIWRGTGKYPLSTRLTELGRAPEGDVKKRGKQRLHKLGPARPSQCGGRRPQPLREEAKDDLILTPDNETRRRVKRTKKIVRWKKGGRALREDGANNVGEANNARRVSNNTGRQTNQGK